jgi:hypothetical protein
MPQVKTSRWNQSQQIYYWPDTDHALTGCVRSLPNGRLASGMLHWSNARPSSVTCDRTCLVTLEPLWNFSRVDRTLLLACPVTPLSLHPTSLNMPRWWTVMHVRSVTTLTLVATGQLIGHVRSLWRARPVTSVELASLWSCVWLGSHLCAWTLLDILDLLLCYFRSCLRCWSSDHLVAFVQVTFCTLLNYKTITCKHISLIWLCWLSTTKIQSIWA